jgi:DNA mismatch repair protein MutS2
VREFRKVVQEVRERTFPEARRKRKAEEPVGLKIGEYVRIESLGRKGVVTKIEEPLKRVEVWTDRGRVKTSLSDIGRVEDTEGEHEVSDPREMRRIDSARSEMSSELNVVGFTVDEALPVVDKFIDQALLYGLKEVQIIHGVGSGRLRGAIGQFLHDHQGVKRFVPGEGRGGAGVTVVELL